MNFNFMVDQRQNFTVRVRKIKAGCFQARLFSVCAQGYEFAYIRNNQPDQVVLLPSFISNIPVWKEIKFKSQLSILDTKGVALSLLNIYNQNSVNLTNLDFVLDFLRNIKVENEIVSDVSGLYSAFGQRRARFENYGEYEQTQQIGELVALRDGNFAFMVREEDDDMEDLLDRPPMKSSPRRGKKKTRFGALGLFTTDSDQDLYELQM